MKHRFGLLARVALAMLLGVLCGFFLSWMGRSCGADVQCPLRAVPGFRHSAADLRSGGSRHCRPGPRRRAAARPDRCSGLCLYAHLRLRNLLCRTGSLSGSACRFAAHPSREQAVPAPYFTVEMPPVMGIMSALVLAFILRTGHGPDPVPRPSRLRWMNSGRSSNR